MDNGAHDTVWGVLSDLAVAGVMALGGAVAWLWRKVAQVDGLAQRVDSLSAAIDHLGGRQSTIEHEQGDQRMLLTEMRTDIRWTREAVEDIKHRLEYRLEK